jgi:hypothetical protein
MYGDIHTSFDDLLSEGYSDNSLTVALQRFSDSM